jgi:hypothetical protein
MLSLRLTQIFKLNLSDTIHPLSIKTGRIPPTGAFQPLFSLLQVEVPHPVLAPKLATRGNTGIHQENTQR